MMRVTRYAPWLAAGFALLSVAFEAGRHFRDWWIVLVLAVIVFVSLLWQRILQGANRTLAAAFAAEIEENGYLRSVNAELRRSLNEDKVKRFFGTMGESHGD